LGRRLRLRGGVDRAREPVTGRFGGNRPADGEAEIVAPTPHNAPAPLSHVARSGGLCPASGGAG
jgi:hypothetical protein